MNPSELRRIASAVEFEGASPETAAEALRLAADGIERLQTGNDDDLAERLLQRGGFATIQLNPDPHGKPRMRFVNPEKTVSVSAAKIGGAIIVRKPAGENCGTPDEIREIG